MVFSRGNRRGVSRSGILAAMLVMVLGWPLSAAPPRAQDQAPLRVGGSVRPPKKLKDVRPVYPESARLAGMQGISIVEAVIDANGLVSEAKVIRSLDEPLDSAAVDAVRQWEFTPTLLNGVPVPVIMTVTVNFTLDAAGNVVPSPPPPDNVTSSVAAQEPVMWSPGDPPVRVGGDIKAPRKIKNVAPVYPPDARAAGRQGVVILELWIDEDGWVKDAKVIRSVEMLDDAARDAALQWEFTPTLLNGVPIPVIMTVTVNFSLE